MTNLNDVVPGWNRPSTPEDCKDHGVKFDAGKPRVELVPPRALLEVAQVFSFGAKKYGDHNYMKGMGHTRMAAAGVRHVFAWFAGEDKDPESGLHHIAHAACCALMLLESVIAGVGTDDRWKGSK